MSDDRPANMAVRRQAWDALWAILLTPSIDARDKESAPSVPADEAPIECSVAPTDAAD